MKSYVDSESSFCALRPRQSDQNVQSERENTAPVPVTNLLHLCRYISM